MPESTSFPWTTAGEELQKLAADINSFSIIDALRSNSERCELYRAHGAGLTLDYSRHLLTDEARTALLNLAQEAGLESARQQLFDGSTLNASEGRAVSHTLLRAAQAPAGLDAEFESVQNCRRAMEQWVNKVRSGEHTGFDGQSITDIVNLGIGGSDLGPRMVCQALDPISSGPRVHFVANIDPQELTRTVASLDPARTLFIICSKTLSTEETLNNAQAAKRWLLKKAPESAVSRHFLAVSTNLDAAAEFGIPAANMLPLWDWVGGRYSLWSAIGWSIAFAAGQEAFDELLAGAEAMDQHFLQAPPEHNLPMLMSLLEVWSVNFLGAASHAVIPYSHALRRLPAFLQQLTMESNGKAVRRDGTAVDYATAPVLWGEEGSNGQHSFHQLLHQGTIMCPTDFVVPLTATTDEPDMQRRLLANAISQAQALLLGRDLEASRDSLLQRGFSTEHADSLAPQLVIPGNRPSSTISFDSLTPGRLGALLALYEHRTFCSGWIWHINSFDQWGVELGKALGGQIYKAMDSDQPATGDPSSDALIRAWQALQ